MYFLGIQVRVFKPNMTLTKTETRHYATYCVTQCCHEPVIWTVPWPRGWQEDLFLFLLFIYSVLTVCLSLIHPRLNLPCLLSVFFCSISTSKVWYCLGNLERMQCEFTAVNSLWRPPSPSDFRHRDESEWVQFWQHRKRNEPHKKMLLMYSLASLAGVFLPMPLHNPH